jgi:hypothetical protein
MDDFGGLGLAVAAVLIAVQALSILSVPQRWLARAQVLWVTSPLIATAIALLWANLFRSPQWLTNTLLGIGLVGFVFVLPWLVLCLVGFGFGLVLRRVFRGRPSAIAITIAAQPLSQPPPLAMAGWRSVHVGFAQDGLTIAGCDIWAGNWREMGEVVQLPHPAHPAQLHRYEVYETGTAPTLTRFAAAELSNGVWGFYVPISDTGAAGAAQTHLAVAGWTGQPPVPKANPLAAWRTALAILVGALVAIGAITYLIEQRERAHRKPSALDTVPRLSIAEPPPPRR